MKLAINGGKNVRQKPWPNKRIYNLQDQKETVWKILDSQKLSGFRGSFGQHFWGGEYIRKLEEWFSDYMKSKALTVNSCTSALQIAMGAIGIQSYDEVIVTPWSMTCSATAPMVYGGIPVFADIEEKYFCLDHKSVKEQITEKTKAIIIVDLFGIPYDVEKINKIARKHNLFVIEDSAQALGAMYKDKKAGTLGDIGCFSFTQGKHFGSGEGGMIVTNNTELYQKCALIRNHAEAVINSMHDNSITKFDNMINQHGFNMRMTEIQAAILFEQFKPLTGKEVTFDNSIDYEIFKRNRIVKELRDNVQIPGIEICDARDNCLHAYYVLPILFNEDIVGISRHKFIEAVKAELRIEDTNMGITQKIDPLIWEGYIKPIYKMPIFEYKHGYYGKKLSTVETLQENKFCFTTFQSLDLYTEDINDIINAFYKVNDNKGELSIDE